MSVAVAPNSIKQESAELIETDTTVLPEKAIKMGLIHNEKDRFYWDDADAIAEFATENNIK